jgi:hypothetical protein
MEVFLCLKTKFCPVETVVRILLSLFQSKNSSPKRVSPMNPAVARLVGQPENNKAALIAAVMDANSAKCSRLSVRHVEKKQVCLSNPQAIDRYTVAIATNHVLAATGKTNHDHPLRGWFAFGPATV